MGLITPEESIRGCSNFQLEEMVGKKRSNYSDESIEIAEDELMCRKLNSLNPIEQIHFIKSLSSRQIELLVRNGENRFSSTIMNIIQTEYSNRGMEEPEWYYLDNNNPIGPIKLSELKKLAEYGTLFHYSMVFKQGTQNWINAGSIPGIFGFANTTIQNFPLPPPPMYANGPMYYQNANKQENNSSEELGCGLSIIIFLIPIIGIVLYFTEKNKKGNDALIIAIVSIIIGTFFYVMFFPTIWFF